MTRVHGRYAPVHASADRVVRTVAGLRPFRRSGFVVRSERIADKLIVHNYGHGGAGVTLSWGTASLAVSRALADEPTSAVVLGAGAVGLATARLLQRRGVGVTIYAEDLPPNTTSNIAGALCFATSVHEPGQARPEFMKQLAEACRISQRIFQSLIGPRYGVRWLESHFLSERFEEADYPGGPDLYPAQRLNENSSVFFGAPYSQQLTTMMIDSTVYLDALVRDFREAGGELILASFDSLSAVMKLPQRVIVNCTGLGSRELIGDTELAAVKGQLVVLPPQPEIDYAYVDRSSKDLLYMLPRQTEILLGGTIEHDNWSRDVDSAQVERILQGHRDIAAAMNGD